MAFNFKVFDTVAMAEEGSTLHLIIPATGELAYDGDTPVTITLKGPKSKAGRDALTKSSQRSKAILRRIRIRCAVIHADVSARQAHQYISLPPINIFARQLFESPYFLPRY